MAKRTEGFRRNERLEQLLAELGEDLQPAEDGLLAKYQGCGPRYPIVLVMGPLRSGTTLFTQWLANTGIVAYPSNLLSRFYQTPILGAKIQLLLTDCRYSFRDELIELARQVEYRSENGKTRGVLAPNEFWYFWRRFLNESGRDVWTDAELASGMDVQTLLAELAGVTDVFGKPFLAKAMLFNYNIPFLDSILGKVIFVQMRRDPESNVASVLDARVRQYGTDSRWYSFEIPEYDELCGLPPAEQVAGQIYYINKAIDKGLEGVAESRKLTVQYEDLCSSPQLIYEGLVEKLAENGYPVNDKYIFDQGFQLSRSSEVNPVVQAACRKFFG